MNWLAVVGDAVWIMTLSLIAGASRASWRVIPPHLQVPMPMILGQGAGWRASKPVALLLTPLLATVFGLALGAAARRPPEFAGSGSWVPLSETATALPFVRLIVASMKFMAGLPMKPATNRFTGRS